jgi:tetratricopeptide (TPR) repeat protein
LDQALEISKHIGSVSQQIQVLLQLSTAEYRGSGDYAQAQADAAKAIDMAQSNGLENLTARGLIDLGNAYFLKGDADEARKAYTQSLEYARRYRSERNEARALFSLGNLALRYGDTDDGIRNVQQALVWFQRGGYQKESANALVLLARAQRQKGDYAGALQSFEQQLLLANRMADSGMVALAQHGRGTVLEAQGRLPEALAAYRDAYDASHKAADDLNAAYNLLNTAGIYWRLGRYREARQAIADVGLSPVRAVVAIADQTRADMALSQGDFASAMKFSQQVLDQPNLTADLQVKAKGTLGLARIASGLRREGLAAVAEAEQVAEKSSSAWLIAGARLAYAEALLAAGDAQRARGMASAAQQWFAGAGNQAAEWRCLLAVAGAEKALGDTAKSLANTQKTNQIVAGLKQKWDSDSYKTYLDRPDIQERGRQLARLAAAR